MKLSLLAKTYAICRLPPNTTPPAWLFEGAEQPESSGTDDGNNDNDHDCFDYSLTKTNEELSIVCRQNLIPSNTKSIGGESDNVNDFALHSDDLKIERDWVVFKVQGPLDFGLTGILASLSQTLAQANISIFAVSTFDTDYILVKQDNKDAARQALITAGHIFSGGTISQDNNQATSSTLEAAPPKKPGTRDGPATTFEPDPLVSRLVLDKSCFNEPTFYLVMIAGWPPDKAQLETPYTQFLQAVKECWNSEDLLPSFDEKEQSKKPSNVYLYPVDALHSTVATFFRQGVAEGSYPPEEERTAITKAWTRVVERATQLPEWPTQPLQLVIDSAQIGTRAGIILWKETTGGMDTMRNCITAATKELDEQGWFNQFETVSAQALIIPGIVHSTFLRFYNVPTTPGATVQDRFREKVFSKLSHFFPDPIEVPLTNLICERTPYLHIPHDDDHVFATSFLCGNESDRYITDAKLAEERRLHYYQK